MAACARIRAPATNLFRGQRVGFELSRTFGLRRPSPFCLQSSSSRPFTSRAANTGAGRTVPGFALAFAIAGSFVWYQLAYPTTITQNQAIEPFVKKDLSDVTDNDPMRLRMEAFVKDQQQKIITVLESLEPEQRFRIDSWTRPEGGDGISAVLQDGKTFEKAGVMVSVVHGKLGPAAVEKMRADHSKIQANPSGQLPFFACGLSLVLHPVNPHAPTVHMNYRYFQIENADGTSTSWFGGGTDLTPSYLYNEDAIHFHKTLKETCDRHDKRYYPDFKKWCDKYFYVEHRKETRGIGGIFFDDLDDKDPNEVFSFVKDACNAFLPCYLPIIQKRMDTPYTQAQKDWQQIRRGRYVEFNLVLDRGTQFGLRTPGARIESILMSLPLTARWEYMHSVEPDSKEDRLLQVLRQPREWV